MKRQVTHSQYQETCLKRARLAARWFELAMTGQLPERYHLERIEPAMGGCVLIVKTVLPRNGDICFELRHRMVYTLEAGPEPIRIQREYVSVRAQRFKAGEWEAFEDFGSKGFHEDHAIGFGLIWAVFGLAAMVLSFEPFVQMSWQSDLYNKRRLIVYAGNCPCDSIWRDEKVPSVWRYDSDQKLTKAEAMNLALEGARRIINVQQQDRIVGLLQKAKSYKAAA